MPRLILVDGFAGTGKSTAAQRLWLHLNRAGRTARWVHEHERAHPIFEYGEVEELLQQTPAKFEQQLVSRWTRWVKQAATRDPGVTIIEGAFLQIPVGVMTAMGMPPVRIHAALGRIAAVLAGTDVSLIYLFHADLKQSLQRTGALRGPQWLAEMIAAVGASPYGRRRKVTNLGGLVAFYERQRDVVESALPRLGVMCTKLEAGAGHWTRDDREIAAFTGIRPVAEPVETRDQLLKHVGAYRSASGLPALVTTDARRLYVHLPATRALPLVCVRPGEFVAESLPIDVRFTYARRGEARRFRYDSRMSNEVLADTEWVRA